MGAPLFFFSFLHREFFETLERYRPGGELLRLVEERRPQGWQITPGGFWTSCIPPNHQMKLQGWKIHISGTTVTAIELLSRIVPLLIEKRVAFKFCSDLKMVALSTNKNWYRTAAGKVLTIYPESTGKFVDLIQRCYDLTRDLAGPYILTDRPYKDSRVVFYRYGGHRYLYRLDAQGRRVSIIRSPLGQKVPDERKPLLHVPLWEKDPFEPTPRTIQPATHPREILLRNGRYKVNGALTYSAVGGIYTAIDTSTAEVIIREARPFLNYSIDVLKKEARILQKLESTGVAPRFVDLFEEGGHWFLVQERLRAESLWGYAMGFTLGKEASRNPAELFRRIRDTICELSRGLQLVHDKQIILRDLTKTNVLFTQDKGQESVKFIDYEFSYEIESSEPPVPGFTAGYGSPQQKENQLPQFTDDYYALGALILDSVAFTAAGLDLNRAGTLLAFRQTLDDLGLPHVLAELVESLTNPDPATRYTPTMVERKLLDADAAKETCALDPIMVGQNGSRANAAAAAVIARELQSTLDGITRYIFKTLDYSRDDRLWPASPQVFLTNPVSIRFGAAGIAFYLLQVAGEVPGDVVDWILKRATPTNSPPGLYSGLAGVAVFLLHAGFRREAVNVLKSASDAARNFEIPGLYDGASGWGLANLHFWLATGESAYLYEAVNVGEHLMRSVKSLDGNIAWESNEKFPVGLGFGPSGIGLFLLYLYLAQGNAEYLALAKQAVLSDIAAGVWLDERVYHHDYHKAASTAPKSPHMRYGSGGVGTAALRVYAVTGEEPFRSFSQSCADTVSSRYTNKLWQDWGLSGFGELLLDSARFLRNERYLQKAYYIAEGLLPYRMFREDGVAFPGSELMKISCDFGLGSAGIGMFLHRLLHPELHRFLLLDELMERKSRTELHSPVQECLGLSLPVKR